MYVALLLGGLVLLIVGAELLVRGASRLAAAAGIAPLIIGLTVVAFGTSAPELAVSIKAAAAGQSQIAVGNVVGSNIFNVLFILGVSALIVPLAVSRQLIRVDVPLMIAVSVAALLLGMDGNYGRLDGLLLFGGLLVYIGFLIYYGSAGPERELGGDDLPAPAETPWVVNVVFVLGGLALLVLGSRWLVDGAISIARVLGVSEVIVGLTIVAAGTSMPEVVTSIVASLRGERDIAVGNVVGSNIFNLLGVLGLASIIAGEGTDVSAAMISFDIPVMIAVAFACLPIFFTGGAISRWEGGVLLAYYVAYTTYLILAATDHDALSEFSAVMLYFTIPLTAITLAVITIQVLRGRGRR